ncbi:hypothetical protein D9M71_641700 [compost metagenome]
MCQRALERARLQHLAITPQSRQQQSLVVLELTWQHAQAGLAYRQGRDVMQGVVKRIGVGQHDHLAADLAREVQAVVGVQLAHRFGVDAQAVLEQADEAFGQVAFFHAIQIPDQVWVGFLAEVDFLEADGCAHCDGAVQGGSCCRAQAIGCGFGPSMGRRQRIIAAVCVKSMTTHQSC